MPRVMMIRHGESEDNVNNIRLSISARNGQITKEEFVERMELLMSPDGDAPLSARGEEQAERLGEYYAPALAHAAREGHLHFFNSPFLRNLQTAAPLIRRLREEHGVVVTSQVWCNLGEVPGLVRTSQMKPVQQVLEQGGVEKAREQLAQTRWEPAGMSGNQIRERFPWTSLQHEAFPDDLDAPWYVDGYETPTLAVARVKRVALWLRSECRRLGPHDIVAFVCHGHTMALLLQQLLSFGDPAVYFENIDNTSVTMLIVGEVAQGPGPKRMLSLFPQESEECGVQLELFSRTEHLGTERVQQYLQYVGVMPRPPRKARGAAKL